MSTAETEKKAQHTYDICEDAQSLWWLVRVAHSMACDPIPSPAEARRYRRAFKQNMRKHSVLGPELKRLWDMQAQRMPGLVIASGRPRVDLSGLILYVLTAIVAQVRDHARDDFGDPGERERHFERAGDFAREVYAAGKQLPDFGRSGTDRTIVAHLLGVQRKLVDLRLQSSGIRAEIEAGRKRGHIPWVDPNWIWRAVPERQWRDRAHGGRGRKSGS